MSEYTTAGFGATINGKHTWKDYGLVIGNTDIVSEPSPKTNYIEMPGSSIRIDLTETLTGQVEYESRQLKFSLGKMEREDLWPVFYRTFLRAYQGKEVRVVLDQEPDVYYHGRAEVSGFSRNGRLGTFTLTIDADAYKYEINVSSEDWLWDVLNFETGIIRDYRGISVSGSSSKLLEGSGIPVVPVFYVNNLDESASNYITFNGTRYILQQGRNRFADLVIPVSGGRLYFYGTYTVSIEFRGGSL